MEIDLSGETAIVTGAGRGIGAVIADAFAEAGADVVTVARTDSEISEVAGRLESEHGVRSLAIPTDLEKVADIEDLFTTTLDELGTPSVLVNNAGANIAKPPMEMTPEEVDTMLDVNLRGLFIASQLFGSLFRDSSLESGSIINVSSIAAEVGVPAMTMYGGTKAGVRGITRGFAAELSPDGITVNSISPGLTRVERTENVMDEFGDDLFDFDRIPARRVGEPEDMAGAAVFLASEYASYITGTDILVDGGVGFTAGLYR
ncbi:MAG: SDR family NAD(P)-dependent oxidoreductase [Halobacteriota archaeon]